jgi:hypothetical protein
MHDLAWDPVVPVGVPAAAAMVLRTARELLRQSYSCYEFSTAAVMHSLIAVEIMLRDRIPDAGTKPLLQFVKQGADASRGARRRRPDARPPKRRPPGRAAGSSSDAAGSRAACASGRTGSPAGGEDEHREQRR